MERLVVFDERKPGLATRWAPPAPDASTLSGSERDVAGLVAHGLSDHAVARVLGIEEAAVDRHLQRILQKLGLPGRLGLA